MAETAVQKAQRQFEEARARLQSAKARESTAERKKMTRRKVILGGALVEHAERDPRFAKVVQVLIDSLSRDQDRKAFEEWEPPSPAESDLGNGKDGEQSDKIGDSRFDLPRS